MNEIGKYDFKVRQGETHVEKFTHWLKDGVPINLGLASEIRVYFKRMVNVINPDLVLTVDNGGLLVEGNNLEFHFGENTLNLSAGIYLYDILLIMDGERYIYVQGKMELMGVITR